MNEWAWLMVTCMFIFWHRFVIVIGLYKFIVSLLLIGKKTKNVRCYGSAS